MLSKLLPYRIFDKFDDISPEYLTSLGVKFLFSDVDNTLAPYEVPEPDERIRSWLDSLKDAGITVVLVSNNHGDRIELFNRTLGLAAYADCKKPGYPSLLSRKSQRFNLVGVSRDCYVNAKELFDSKSGSLVNYNLSGTASILYPSQS